MEIGGDFWKESIENQNNKNENFYKIGKDNKFLMSGRTAIDTALQDILKENNVKNVYFPSYACESMVQPFQERNINVIFYNVYYDKELKYDIDVEFDCDIFFAMNYFGYTATNMEQYIKKFKEKNVIVIEDITHSIFSKKAYSYYSDYIVASLRKWFPINCGGILSKLNGEFLVDFESFKTNQKVVKNKQKAMNIKLQSIKNNSLEQNKEIFLQLYKISNNAIKEDYRNKLIDQESNNYLLNFDIKKMINSRNKNVNTIYRNIDRKYYDLLIKKYNKKEDCLLYVPIYLEKNMLKKLKKKIYENKFYCPSHWPISIEVNDLFEYELSIICDQRYDENQIEEKMKLMNKYLGEI